MREKELISMVKEDDLPENFRIVSELCGLEVAKSLLTELGGIQIAIPKVTSLNKVMIRYIKERHRLDSPKKLARDLDISERTLRRILEEARTLEKVKNNL